MTLVPAVKPYIRRKEMDAVLSCMIDDTKTLGEAQLVKDSKSFFGVSACFSYRDRRRAFDALLNLIEPESGSEIILSPLSSFFFKEEIEKRGVKCVLCDVEETSGCLSSDKVQDLVNEKTVLVILSSCFGVLPEKESFKELNVPLLVDLNSGFTDPEYIPEARHYLVSMEDDSIVSSGGGALLATEVKGDKKSQREWEKLPDINAALALGQLRDLTQITEKRQQLSEIYRQAVMKTEHYVLSSQGNSVYNYFPVILKNSLKDIKRYIQEKGFETLIAFEDSIVREYRLRKYPNALSLSRRCLLFPVYPSLNKKNIETLSRILSALP